MKRVRDFIGYLLSLVMIVGLMLPLASMDVNAATPREVTARVTKFTIQNIAGTDKSRVLSDELLVRRRYDRQSGRYWCKHSNYCRTQHQVNG